METSTKRSLAYGGLLFVAIVVVAVVIASPPSTNATADKVMSYYHAHQGITYASAYLITLAVLVGIPYFWFLREHLARTATEGRKLLTIGFAGAILFAVSGLLGAGMKFVLADGSHAGNIPSATLQALNLLQQDFNTPANAAGTALFLIPTGLAIVRAGGLPRWLGWVGIVLGIISATGFAGPIGVGLWILAASITTLVQRHPRSAAAPNSNPAP
ncbi:MAG: DUF4386 family protein [Acidimicrobiales bacterium]|nr:DUF4386 family protein [Acidimicrobiales bacterium]